MRDCRVAPLLNWSAGFELLIRATYQEMYRIKCVPCQKSADSTAVLFLLCLATKHTIKYQTKGVKKDMSWRHVRELLLSTEKALRKGCGLNNARFIICQAHCASDLRAYTPEQAW